MIVKDEKEVIRQSLKSVKPFIDYWVIVDTGSTDGTQEIIEDFLKDIPGELHEQPWVNFGHNRNEALKLAKGKADYVLFIDADEILEGTFDKDALKKDCHLIVTRTSSDPLLTFQKAFLINGHQDWVWSGVLHEKLTCSKPEINAEVLSGTVLSAESRDGNRSKDPTKYLKDAHVLEKALLEDPDNADYVFYLAQSYFNAEEYKLALKNYEKRANMDGWDQHTFWAKYSVGCLQEMLDMAPELIIQSYSEAYQYRPIRAEPLWRLGQYFYKQKNFLLGYLVADHGLSIQLPDDYVYVEPSIYDWSMLALKANCALEIKKYKEAAEIYEKLETRLDLKDETRKQAKESAIWARSQLK